MLGAWTMLVVSWCLGRVPQLAQAAGCTPTLSSDCGQLCYTADHGTVTLPTLCAGKYCDNMRCDYHVCPSTGNRVRIVFLEMKLECPVDYLDINRTKFCQVPDRARTFPLGSNGCVEMTFVSDQSVAYSGFTLTYSTGSLCPMRYTANTANVSLPTQCGGKYCPNTTCYIGICPASTVGQVTLTFSMFDLDDNKTCSKDVLEIDGVPYCSMDSVPRVFTLDHSGCLNLTFRSDASEEGRGFSLSYHVGEATSCPAIYAGRWGVVVPPATCQNQTSPSPSCPLHCALKVCPEPQARQVTLTARQWDLSCDSDFLEAGGRRYCQDSPRGEVLALDSSGCLDLHVHRAGLRAGDGFQLFYSLDTPECGVADLVADSGLLTIPRACQGRYCNNLDCSYHLCPPSASPGLALSLLMADFADTSCSHDYVKVVHLNTFCSLTNLLVVPVERWGCVTVEFHSDGHGGGHGFELGFSAYNWTCGALSYSADQGSITLPAECGGKYCSNLNCTYTVCPASRSTHVQLTQRMFHTANANCTEDYLQIDETRICEFDPRPMTFPVGPDGCLAMTFRSGDEGGGFGFRFDYAAKTPGSDVTQDVCGQRTVTVASVLSVVIVVLVAVIVFLCVVNRRQWFERQTRSTSVPKPTKRSSASEKNAYVMHDVREPPAENYTYEVVKDEGIYQNA